MSTTKIYATFDISLSEKYDKGYLTNDRLAFGVGEGASDEYYAYIKFGNLNLGDNKKITKAVLKVTKKQGALGFNASFNAVAQRVTSSWDKSTKWSNKPSATTTGQSSVVATGTGHTGEITFDVTSIVQAWYSGSGQYGILLKQNGTTASRIKCIENYASDNKAFIEITHEDNITAVTKPTSISSKNSIVTPSSTINVEWSGAKAGTNNTIAGYDIYWRIGAAPTTSTYTGKKSINSTSTSGSTSISLSNATRGSSIYVGVITKGSQSGYNSGMATQNIAVVNTLPSAPTVSVDKTEFGKDGGTPKFTIAAGNTNNSGQAATIYYSTSSNSTKDDLETGSFSPMVSSTITYYFYTYDGLEYSSATSKKISVYPSPSAPTVTMTSGSSTLPSSGGSVTFKVVAGAVSKQSASIWYSIGSNGEKKACGASQAFNISSTTTYYFYTKDGMGQYSSATTKKITINTKPQVTSVTITPTTITPSVTQSVDLARKLDLSSKISKTVSTYEWYVAAASSTDGVNTLVNAGAISGFKNIHSSASGSIDIFDTITKGHYYKIGLRVKDSLEYSAIKWSENIMQNPYSPTVEISSISSLDLISGYSNTKREFYSKVNLITNKATIGEGYPKLYCTPVYKNMSNNSDIEVDFNVTNENEFEVTIPSSVAAGTTVKFGIKNSFSDDTISTYYKEEVWTKASSPNFSSEASIIINGPGNSSNNPVKPYSIKDFSFGHTASNSEGLIGYNYELIINGKTITPELTDTGFSNEYDVSLKMGDWDNFNTQVGHSADAPLNKSYDAILKIYPKNKFGQLGSSIQTTVYFDYREYPSISLFKVSSLTTPAGNTLTYGTNGFGTSDELTNNSLQFQNGDTLTFKIEATDKNNDLKNIELYKNNTKVKTYDYSNEIKYECEDKMSGESVFYAKVIDSTGLGTESSKVTLYQTIIDSPKADFSIQDIAETEKIIISFNMNNIIFGDSKIGEESNLNRYGLTTTANNKKILTLNILDSENNQWKEFGKQKLNDYNESFTLLFESEGSWNNILTQKETAKLQFELKILYDYNKTNSQEAYTTFTSPILTYYFEAPTISHRKNRIGINTKSYKDNDVFVIKKSSNNYIIRLVGEGEGKEILIDLDTLTIKGATIDGAIMQDGTIKDTTINGGTIDGAIINGGTWD